MRRREVRDPRQLLQQIEKGGCVDGDLLQADAAGAGRELDQLAGVRRGNRFTESAIERALVVAPYIAAVYWKLWVLTAIPVGFLFGFFLQKGDLCGSSAFSEVVLERDGRKVFGLWVAIVTAMCGFAVLDLVGLVTLNPKPLIYWNYLLGGLAFGIGIVLAGGCVSGCLYKAGTGNLNSIAALLAMPAGIALVEYGPLHDWFSGIKRTRLANPDGSSVTLSSVTGVPFWLLAGALMVGSFASARLSVQARLLPKPPGQILWAILGGFLVGAGAAIATGCVIGNILSGWALLSVGSLFFGVVVILTNWLTTWLYLMGADRSTWSR